MGMVAEEGAEPMGPEFRKTFDEQNFGLALKDALEETIRAVWERRSDRYSELRTLDTVELPKVEMSFIGG